MMTWKELPAERRKVDLSRILMGFGFIQAADLIRWTIREPPIMLGHGVDEEIHDHVSSGPDEMGGLLLGHTCELPYATRHGYDHLTAVRIALPSREFVNSGCSLEMGTEIWSRASVEIARGLQVVGWYHSHPGLGAFFSLRDRATQAAFFDHGYSLGVVIDTVRGEKKCFAGPHSEEIRVSWLGSAGALSDWSLVFTYLADKSL